MNNLVLTNQDFDSIIEGLDAITPNKKGGGPPKELVQKLIRGAVGDDAGKGRELMREWEEQSRRHEAEASVEHDRLKILQGKLLQFKNVLIENDLMKQVNISLGNNDEKESPNNA